MSSLTKGTFSSASARYRSSIGGIETIGEAIIFSAGIAVIFLILIVADIVAPTLLLASPSSLTIPFFSSAGYNGRHFPTERLFPVISTISPDTTSSNFIES